MKFATVFLYQIIIILIVINNVVDARGGGRGGGRGRSGSRSRSAGRGYKYVRGHSSTPNREQELTNVKSYFIATKGQSNYYYNPPNRMTYKCYNCSTATAYPVYRAQPPAYVADYGASTSRFRNLLTGLALLNLGRSSHNQNYLYQRVKYEKCCLQVINKLVFDETRVPCYLLSTFVNLTNDNILSKKGKQIDVSSSTIDDDVQQSLDQSVALLDVWPDMVCMLWHNTTINKVRTRVACGLLLSYAATLEEEDRTTAPKYMFIFIVVGFVLLLAIGAVGSALEDRKAKKKLAALKETVPLNVTQDCVIKM